MTYFIKASIVIAVFYLCYALFLKRETFFVQNRWFLLSGLCLASVFPFVVIPIEIPVEPVSYSYSMVSDEASAITPETATAPSFDWLSLLPIVYGIGLVVFFVQFVLQFGSLAVLLLKNPKQKDGFYTYVIIKNKVSPFSFFKWIVFNPKTYSSEELNLVLAHEKVHVNQMHSIDMLFTQLACVVFWFNPIVWLYKKDVAQNLEYIADATIQNHLDNQTYYQRLLLKATMANYNMALANNFYHSLIKKRIVMLQKTKSNSKKKWRYALMLPIVLGLLLSMNTKEVYVETASSIVKETSLVETEPLHKISEDAAMVSTIVNTPAEVIKKTTPKVDKKKVKTTIAKGATTLATAKLNSKIVMPTYAQNTTFAYAKSEFIITKNTTDGELETIKNKLKAKGLTVKIRGVKRNRSGEITAIKIDTKTDNANSNYNIKANEGISPITISYDAKTNSIAINNDKIHRANVLVTKGKVRNATSNSVYVISSDEVHENDEDVIVETVSGNNTVKIVKGNAYEVITEDVDADVIVEKIKDAQVKVKGNYVYHIVTGDDDDHDIDIIVDDKGHKTIKQEVSVNGDKIEFIKGKSFKNEDDIFIVKTSKNKSKIVFTGDEDKNPLYVVDGKTYTKAEIEDMELDYIETVNVLKGDKAIEKYGDKAKDGVVIISTKKE